MPVKSKSSKVIVMSESRGMAFAKVSKLAGSSGKASGNPSNGFVANEKAPPNAPSRKPLKDKIT
jgi:hypothetical protein